MESRPGPLCICTGLAAWMAYYSLSELPILSLQQLINYRSGFPTWLWFPLRLLLRGYSLSAPLCLSNLGGGSSLLCHLTSLMDLSYSFFSLFKWHLPSFLHAGPEIRKKSSCLSSCPNLTGERGLGVKTRRSTKVTCKAQEWSCASAFESSQGSALSGSFLYAHVFTGYCSMHTTIGGVGYWALKNTVEAFLHCTFNIHKYEPDRLKELNKGRCDIMNRKSACLCTNEIPGTWVRLLVFPFISCFNSKQETLFLFASALS